MGKRTRDQENTTVLYKKSQHTIYTQSRTCSGLSQIYTKSGIIHIKKSISQSQYYVKGDKIKRDLSIETDICVLRRYVKQKKNKLSTHDGSKSRYSTVVDTEIDTIEEFQRDTSARRDSELPETNNIQYDIAQVMMDNFKLLLNSWIDKYLLDGKDTGSIKTESVLYSLLHRTQLDKTNVSSSRSTYVLNREFLSQEVKNKKIATRSIICQYCKKENWIMASKEKKNKESSCHSTPASHKNNRVISTLSIPKNLHKEVQDRRNIKSNHKIKKNKHKNIVLPINEPSKLLDYSNFDLLTISTKSFTKRCATYDCDGKKKKHKKKRHIVFLPKPFFKSATDTTTDETKLTRQSKKSNLAPLPSLVKSIYADDPANITSTDDNINFFRNDNFTMTDVNNSAEIVTQKTIKAESGSESNVVKHKINVCESVFQYESILNEEDRSDPMVTIDFMNEESLEFTNLSQSNTVKVCTKTRATDTDKAKNKDIELIERRNKKVCRKVSKLKKTGKKTFRIKNDNRSWRSSQRFLGHCENIFQYFADYENKNNMKLDIHITVLPVNNLQNKSTEISRQDLSTMEKSETIVYDVEQAFIDDPEKSSEHNIIPLLDGADNQAKYIFKSESCSEKTTLSHENNAITIDRSTITEAEIKDDINELKSIIKDLAKVAETFVKEYVRKDSKSDTMQKLKNISKGIQFSKHTLLSGIKLSKEPKKIDVNEFYHRLMKKSTSYNIIDSESILRVTDMTSAANEINQINQSLKSLPKSRSMVEVSNDMEKRKLLTYFCDEYDKNDFVYNTCNPAPTSAKTWLKPHKMKKYPEPVCMIESAQLMALVDSNCPGCKSSIECYEYDDDDDEEKCLPDRKPVCRKTGMGFGEGCIYCMLMWIPVILIGSLFYSYVIQEAIYPHNPAIGIRLSGNNASQNIKMSDLGF